ncbi:MAG TPA: ion channel [Xanthobacteraceae bacterium]|nr:ion channel [Xanthobacteraceae bacterium]
MLYQLAAGSLVSLINFAIHAVMTGIIVVATRHTASLTDHLNVFSRVSALLMITMVVLMLAHVVEIGVWAMYYALQGIKLSVDPFEFAFENYTALGYGDVVADGGYRLIGPITALNGLLLIGWSVAIIFEVMRMAEVQVGRVKKRDR